MSEEGLYLETATRRGVVFAVGDELRELAASTRCRISAKDSLISDARSSVALTVEIVGAAVDILRKRRGKRMRGMDAGERLQVGWDEP